MQRQKQLQTKFSLLYKAALHCFDAKVKQLESTASNSLQQHLLTLFEKWEICLSLQKYHKQACQQEWHNDLPQAAVVELQKRI